ncbi:hypothetical protein SAMN02745166_05038 [Prosthecobacter debontii]|uniref:Uncharacterized protein n=1 Tax=Prosthecobacter debontii TaxID=48467 RepID=A0A1T4Z446_9BACT|nr:hypothetical protein SAMN02745166_05038 [Prosthecobacter debontii]
MLLMISVCAKSEIHGTANSFVLDKTVGHNAVDALDTIVSHQLVRLKNLRHLQAKKQQFAH